MQGIQSSYAPQTLQAAPEASSRSIGANRHDTGIQFTVKIEDYPQTMKIFNDLARSKDIEVKQESDVQDYNDYGGGDGLYNTIQFSFKPNNKDGTYSPALQMRISDFHREFQEQLREAGIRNYAPEE
ncbi:hypothetical protein [Pseudomonas sp. Marseille-Q1929]|uniref:hypothetical protein n=1 Tax=Pseudomonas sp. Marseille-Q1929 TaxID=2730402 RepID=UPI001A8E1B29|nr:hypothetical protein [Pseudomonas sp. Marseille-Q1929]MBO0496848.1 hypothetical protein [Pseudomonas sp. Marseille-Q1929]